MGKRQRVQERRHGCVRKKRGETEGEGAKEENKIHIHAY